MSDTPLPASEQVIEQAADGGRLYPSARSLADFLRMLENGQFDADVMTDLNASAVQLEELAETAHGNKLKACLTIKVDIVREPDGLYMLSASHAIKMPLEKRPRSVAWLTEDNLFTPNKPNQGALFGTIRDVSAARAIRN